jgi:hypothetical protein
MSRSQLVTSPIFRVVRFFESYENDLSSRTYLSSRTIVSSESSGSGAWRWTSLEEAFRLSRCERWHDGGGGMQLPQPTASTAAAPTTAPGPSPGPTDLPSSSPYSGGAASFGGCGGQHQGWAQPSPPEPAGQFDHSVQWNAWSASLSTFQTPQMQG